MNKVEYKIFMIYVFIVFENICSGLKLIQQQRRYNLIFEMNSTLSLILTKESNSYSSIIDFGKNALLKKVTVHITIIMTTNPKNKYSPATFFNSKCCSKS